MIYFGEEIWRSGGQVKRSGPDEKDRDHCDAEVCLLAEGWGDLLLHRGDASAATHPGFGICSILCTRRH